MNSLNTINLKVLKEWPIEKLENIPPYLPDKLSIEQIANFSAPQDTRWKNAMIDTLIKLCKSGELEFYGDINGCEWGGNEGSYIANPYENVKGVQVDMGSPMRTAIYNKWRSAPADCLINVCELKKYLEGVARDENKAEKDSDDILKQSISAEPKISQSDDIVQKTYDELQDGKGGNREVKKRKRGQTEIMKFLIKLCQEQDINSLSGESLVRGIKPYVHNHNCPVKKYHGFNKEVSIEWKPGTGSIKGTWGSKKFQNFVSDYKKKELEKTCQENISPNM